MMELLNKSHVREFFDCGIPLLNDYLKSRAGQDVKRKLAACYVLTPKGSNKVLGYYTLSGTSIPLSDFPEKIRRKLPKSYINIPCTLIGRLAVDNSLKGQGFGKELLFDAIYRSSEAAKNVGSIAVVVDPIDNSAREFYNSMGFFELDDSGRMFMPIITLIQATQTKS